MALKFGMAGHEIDVMSQRLRVDSETLQKWQFVAGRTGVSLLQLMQMFDQMTKNLGRLDTGTERMKALQRLGIDVEMLRSLSPEEQFLTIADAIANADDKTRALGQAQFILGEHVVRLFPLLNEGRAGIARLTDEFDRLGLGMSRDQVKAATAFRNAWFVLGQQLNTIMNQLGAAVAPVLTELANALSPLLASVTFWIKNNQDLIYQIYRIASGVAIAGAGVLAFKGAILAAGAATYAWYKFSEMLLIPALFKLAFALGQAVLPELAMVIVLFKKLGAISLTMPLIAGGINLLKIAFGGLAISIRMVAMAIRTAFIATGVGAVVVLLGFAVNQFIDAIREGRVDLSLFSEIMDLIKEIAMNLADSFKGLAPVVDMLSGMMENAFNFVIVSIRNTLDWISLLSVNWDLTWQLMVKSTHLALEEMDSAIFNWVLMLPVTITQGLLSMFGVGFKLIMVYLKSIAAGVIEIFSFAFRSTTGFITGIIEGVKGLASGKGFVDPFTEQFQREIGKTSDIFGTSGDASGKSFMDEFTRNADAEMLRGEIGDIVEQMRMERERLRAEREGEKGTEEGLLPAAAGNQLAMQVGRSLVESGRMGFAQLGQNIQDALLRSSNELDVQRNDLLQQSLMKQDQLLGAVEGLGEIGGLG